MKYAKSDREGLTPIQLQNRARKRRLAHMIRYGKSQKKGTTLRWPPTGEPIYKTIPAPPPPSVLEIMSHLLAVFPWMRRRKAEAELREKQEAQSIKDKGVSN